MDVKKITASAKTWLPLVLYAALFAVVVYVGVKGWKKLSELFSGKSSSGFTEAQQKSIDDDVQSLEQRMDATYEASQYNQFAETLYQAMNFSSFNDIFTSQGAAIINTMKLMRNDLDVAKTVKAYGARQLHGFGLPDGAPMGLFAAINYDQQQTAAAINADWETKGITYRV